MQRTSKSSPRKRRRGVADSLMALFQWGFNRMRSPKATESANTQRTGSIDDLRGHKYCLAVTYRRTGEPIPTAVWFGVGNGKLYFRTLPANGKTKRIRNTSRVLVAPCTSRCTPLGPPFVGSARLLAGTEEAAAEEAIKSNYGMSRRVYQWLVANRVTGRYVEVTPTSNADQ